MIVILTTISFFLFYISLCSNFVNTKIKYEIGQKAAWLSRILYPFACVGCGVIQVSLIQGQL